MYFKYGCVIELVSATYMLVILYHHALWIKIKRVWKWNKDQAYPHRPLWKYINFKIYKGNVEYNNDNVFLVIELHKHREIIMKKITQKVQLREICWFKCIFESVQRYVLIMG